MRKGNQIGMNQLIALFYLAAMSNIVLSDFSLVFKPYWGKAREFFSLRSSLFT